MSFWTVFAGIGLVLLFRIFDKKTIRVDWQALGGFLAFMAVVTFLRISMYDLIRISDPEFFPTVHDDLMNMPKFLFALVWWEDGFFVLPIALAHKFLTKRWAVIFSIIFSVHFGVGHIYQGLGAVFVTALYPYFVAHRFGKKYGYGTVMVGHVLYDYITYYTVILAPLFL